MPLKPRTLPNTQQALLQRHSSALAQSIKGGPLEIKLTENTGVSHVDLADFEFPTLDHIKGLKTLHKKALIITGFS